MSSYLDGVSSLGVVCLLLLLLLRLQRLLSRRQVTAKGAGELRAKVKRRVLLLLVQETEVRSLCGVDDCEDTGDSLADVGAVATVLDPIRSPHQRGAVHSRELRRRSTRDLLCSELDEFLSQVFELLEQLLLLLAQSWWVLTFALDWMVSAYQLP